MGLLNLFGKGKLPQKKIDKVAKLASNPFAQPDVRMREMQRLLDDGTDAAYRGVLKRFSTNAQGPIADEEEKTWLEDALVERGEETAPALRDFICRNERLTYALRAFRRICGEQAAVRFFVEVMQTYGPEDHRSGEAKLQLIWQLSDDLASGQVIAPLTAFLHDHSDDVRWAVMDLVERAADASVLGENDRAAACERLGALVLHADVGPRIQRRAADILARREWPLPGDAQALAPLLEDEFFIDKKRFLRRRIKKS